MPSLDELLKQQESNQASHSSGVRMFIAQKEEIAKSISEQWKLLEIWKALHDAGKMPVSYRSFTNYVNRFITNPQQSEKEKGVATKNNGVEGNSTLAARLEKLEKPLSVNTNISEATISKPERQEKLPRGGGGSSSTARTSLKEAEDPKNHPNSPIFDKLSMVKAPREPRGIGNVPKPNNFGDEIDMTGKFEIDESYITQTPTPPTPKPKFYYDSKAKESIMDSD